MAREEFGRKLEKDEEKKNRFSKLHCSFKNMLLMALSIDGDRAASEVCPSCMSFFKQETAGLADQQLLVLFREMGLPDVGFAHEVVQAFLSGQFLYFEPECPNNFSIFSFYEKLREIFDNELRLLMHLKAKDGRAKTNEEITDSLRQVVVAPSGFTSLKEHVKIFRGLNQIFLGKGARSTLGLGSFG